MFSNNKGNVELCYRTKIVYGLKSEDAACYCFSQSSVCWRWGSDTGLRVVFTDLGIGTSVLTFIPVSPLLDHK